MLYVLSLFLPKMKIIESKFATFEVLVRVVVLNLWVTTPLATLYFQKYLLYGS